MEAEGGIWKTGSSKKDQGLSGVSPVRTGYGSPRNHVLLSSDNLSYLEKLVLLP